MASLSLTRLQGARVREEISVLSLSIAPSLVSFHRGKHANSTLQKRNAKYLAFILKYIESQMARHMHEAIIVDHICREQPPKRKDSDVLIQKALGVLRKVIKMSIYPMKSK